MKLKTYHSKNQTFSVSFLRLAAAALVVLFGAGVFGAGISTSAFAEPLSVSVRPETGLLDGQYVEVGWAGYPPNKGVTLAQCKSAPSSLDDCAPTSKISRTGPDGTGKTTFRVATGELGPGFSCGSESPCSVGVFWGDFGKPVVFSQGAFDKIEFAFALSSCPPLTGDQIGGTGSSSGYQAILRWEAAVCREPHSLNVQYTVKNSVGGLEDFAAGESDFAVSAVPLTTEHAENAAESKPFAYVASSLSGVAFGYTIFDQVTGAQVTNLKLTPKLAAEIFTGTMLNPNTDNRDDGIKKLNPGVNFPSRLRAVGRADKAASTYYMTSWFNSVAKESYEAGGEAYKGGPTSSYPSTGSISLVTGGEAVAKAVVEPRNSGDTEVATFGWMDSSWAAYFGMPMPAVANPSGAYVAPMDPDALRAGADAASAKSGEGFPMPDYATREPKAYPLPMVNHFLAPTSTDAARASVMKSFFSYTLGEGQKELPPGYAPLPESMAASSRESASKISGPPTGQTLAGNSGPGVRASGAGSEGAEESEDEEDGAAGEEGGLLPGGDSDAEILGASPGFAGDGFGADRGFSSGASVQAPPQAPARRASPPSLIQRIAEIVGKANPLTGSSSWLILPGLALVAVASLVMGPAIGLPAWAGVSGPQDLKVRLLKLLKR